MPKTAVFFPAIVISYHSLRFCRSLSRLAAAIGGNDRKLVGYIACAGHFCRFCLDSLLLFIGSHRTFEGHGSVLRNHLHVVGVGGKRFVSRNGFPYLFGGLAVRFVVL